jgi:hypothetical protein
MKKLILFMSIFLFFSCIKEKYTYMGQEIIDGKVSAVKAGIERDCRGCVDEYPTIWVQTPTTTRKVELPFEYEKKWKVGDKCLLIIEKYKENR